MLIYMRVLVAGPGRGHSVGRDFMARRRLDFRKVFHGACGCLGPGTLIRCGRADFHGNNILTFALKWSIIEVMKQEIHKIMESSIFRGIMKNHGKNNFRLNLTFPQKCDIV